MSLSTRIKEILPASLARVGFCCALALLATLAAPSGSALAANWTLRQLPPVQLPEGESYEAGLSGVSCPSESLCVAVGGQDIARLLKGADRRRRRMARGEPLLREELPGKRTALRKAG